MIDNQTDTTAPTFDRASLLERVDGDDALLGVILDVFLEDSPNSLMAIRQALETGNSADLRMAAHALRGAAANISAERLREAAHLLEQIAVDGRMADGAAAVQQVENAMTALTPVLLDAVRACAGGGADVC